MSNGAYVGVDGAVTSGASLRELIEAADPSVAPALGAALDHTQIEMMALKAAAEGGLHYDVMLDPANEAGGALIQAAIDGFIAQTRQIERAVAALSVTEIALEGSDSLDDTDAVFE